MNISDLTQKILSLLISLCNDKRTGEVTIKIKLGQGGIRKAIVCEEYDLTSISFSDKDK